jgi:hypothetical protein
MYFIFSPLCPCVAGASYKILLALQEMARPRANLTCNAHGLLANLWITIRHRLLNNFQRTNLGSSSNSTLAHFWVMILCRALSGQINISPYAVTIKQPLFDRNMWARSENLAKTATYLLRRVRNIS